MFKRVVTVLFACLAFTVFVFAAEELDELESVKNNIEKADFSVSMMEANTQREVTKLLKAKLEEYITPNVILHDVAVTYFSPASSGKEDIEGKFKFAAELYCGKYRLTTEIITGVINTSRVELSVSSGKNDVTKGESVELYAKTVDIENPNYEWYRASSENGRGTQIENADGQTYLPPCDEMYSAYFYCMCNGIKSNSVKITVSAPHVAVEDITLENYQIRVGESEKLKYTVYPENATDKNAEWTIYQSDGEIEIRNGEIIGKKQGRVDIAVTVKSSDTASPAFTKTFSVTVLEKEKEPEIKAFGVDTSGLKNVDAMTLMGVQAEMCTVSAMNENDAYNIAKENGIDMQNYDILTCFSVSSPENMQSIRLFISDSKEPVMAMYRTSDGKIVKKQLDENGACVLPECELAIIFGMPTYDVKGVLLLLPMLALPPLSALLIVKIKTKQRKR